MGNKYNNRYQKGSYNNKNSKESHNSQSRTSYAEIPKNGPNGFYGPDGCFYPANQSYQPAAQSYYPPTQQYYNNHSTQYFYNQPHPQPYYDQNAPQTVPSQQGAFQQTAPQPMAPSHLMEQFTVSHNLPQQQGPSQHSSNQQTAPLQVGIPPNFSKPPPTQTVPVAPTPAAPQSSGQFPNQLPPHAQPQDYDPQNFNYSYGPIVPLQMIYVQKKIDNNTSNAGTQQNIHQQQSMQQQACDNCEASSGQMQGPQLRSNQQKELSTSSAVYLPTVNADQYYSQAFKAAFAQFMGAMHQIHLQSGNLQQLFCAWQQFTCQRPLTVEPSTRCSSGYSSMATPLGSTQNASNDGSQQVANISWIAPQQHSNSVGPPPVASQDVMFNISYWDSRNAEKPQPLMSKVLSAPPSLPLVVSTEDVQQSDNTLWIDTSEQDHHKDSQNTECPDSPQTTNMKKIISNLASGTFQGKKREKTVSFHETTIFDSKDREVPQIKKVKSQADLSSLKKPELVPLSQPSETSKKSGVLNLIPGVLLKKRPASAGNATILNISSGVNANDMKGEKPESKKTVIERAVPSSTFPSKEVSQSAQKEAIVGNSMIPTVQPKASIPSENKSEPKEVAPEKPSKLKTPVIVPIEKTSKPDYKSTNRKESVGPRGSNGKTRSATKVGGPVVKKVVTVNQTVSKMPTSVSIGDTAPKTANNSAVPESSVKLIVETKSPEETEPAPEVIDDKPSCANAPTKASLNVAPKSVKKAKSTFKPTEKSDESASEKTVSKTTKETQKSVSEELPTSNDTQPLSSLPEPITDSNIEAHETPILLSGGKKNGEKSTILKIFYNQELPEMPILETVVFEKQKSQKSIARENRRNRKKLEKESASSKKEETSAKEPLTEKDDEKVIIDLSHVEADASDTVSMDIVQSGKLTKNQKKKLKKERRARREAVSQLRSVANEFNILFMFAPVDKPILERVDSDSEETLAVEDVSTLLDGENDSTDLVVEDVTNLLAGEDDSTEVDVEEVLTKLVEKVVLAELAVEETNMEDDVIKLTKSQTKRLKIKRKEMMLQQLLQFADAPEEPIKKVVGPEESRKWLKAEMKKSKRRVLRTAMRIVERNRNGQIRLLDKKTKRMAVGILVHHQALLTIRRAPLAFYLPQQPISFHNADPTKFERQIFKYSVMHPLLSWQDMKITFDPFLEKRVAYYQNAKTKQEKRLLTFYKALQEIKDPSIREDVYWIMTKERDQDSMDNIYLNYMGYSIGQQTMYEITPELPTWEFIVRNVKTSLDLRYICNFCEYIERQFHCRWNNMEYPLMPFRERVLLNIFREPLEKSVCDPDECFKFFNSLVIHCSSQEDLDPIYCEFFSFLLRIGSVIISVDVYNSIHRLHFNINKQKDIDELLKLWFCFDPKEQTQVICVK